MKQDAQVFLQKTTGINCDILRGLSLNSLVDDSRMVEGAAAFVALEGALYHGKEFTNSAIERGARLVICETKSDKEHGSISWVDDQTGSLKVPLIKIFDLRKILANLAANFYNNPGERLSIYGVTGTNGKTSVCHYLNQANNFLGCKFGMIGTLGFGYGPKLKEHHYPITTPSACELAREIWILSQNRVEGLAIELSSHALVQSRCNLEDIDVAIFTNLSHDHLDYHKTEEQYFQAKELLFKTTNIEKFVINADDSYGLHLLENEAKSDQKEIYGYSLNPPKKRTRWNPIWPKNWVSGRDGFQGEIVTPWGEIEVKSPLLGLHNLSNLLTIITSLAIGGHSLDSIVESVGKLRPVPGRFEIFSELGTPKVILDYAHGPGSLEALLTTLRKDFLTKNGKIYCVFGLGGNRDRSKRSLMGAVAEKYADGIIITSDNPRNEKPEEIGNDILKGIRKRDFASFIADRTTAIEEVILTANVDDLVVICGKGEEKYQIFGQTKHFYAGDRLIAKNSLKEYQAR